MALMNLIGLFYGRLAHLILETGNVVAYEAVESTVNYLTNQLWKLIPMRENEEDWKKQAETVLIQISGLNGLCLYTPKLLQIVIKLKGLCVEDTTFEVYRKTVFEMISLLQEFKNEQRV